MSRTTRTLFVGLAAFFSVWSTSALLGNPAILDSWRSLGIGHAAGTLIALAELAAAVGLLVGLRRRNVGALAAASLVAMMAGAVAAHLRVGDVVGAHGAVFVGLLSVGALASVVADIRGPGQPAPAASHTPTGEGGHNRLAASWRHGPLGSLERP